MIRSAVVVPADPTEPHRVVTWAGHTEFLTMLYRELHVPPGQIDSSPPIPVGPAGHLSMWVDDIGLLRHPVDHNNRAIAVCRHLSYDVPDVGGTAVFAGGVTHDEYTDGLSTALLAWLDMALDALTEASRAHRATHPHQ